MPDLNLEIGYLDHPKTRRLVQLCGRGASELPIRLWSYCATYHRADGVLRGYSPQQIETDVLRWWGKPGLALQALLSCGEHLGKAGFLEQAEDGTLWCHGWADHQGHLEACHQAAKKGAKARWDRFRDRQNANRNADRIADRTADRNAPVLSGPVLSGKEERPARARIMGPPQDGAPPEPDPPAWPAPPDPESGPAPEDLPLWMHAYAEGWAARYGRPAAPTPEDERKAKLALAYLPEAAQVECVRAFVADPDPWLVERQHRLGLLPGQLDRPKKRKPAQTKGPSSVVSKPSTRDPNDPGAPAWIRLLTLELVRRTAHPSDTCSCWSDYGRWCEGEDVPEPACDAVEAPTP